MPAALRTSMKACLAAGLLCFGAVGAVAQVPKPASAGQRVAIAEVLDAAIEEHKVFLNCSATVPSMYSYIEPAWSKGVADTAIWLAQHGLDPALIADFASRAITDSLLMRDAPFAVLLAFCSANPEWDRKLYELNYVVLPNALEKVAAE